MSKFIISTNDKEHWSLEYFKKMFIGTFERKPREPMYSDRAIGLSKQLPVPPVTVQKVIDEYPNLTDQQIMDVIIYNLSH